MRSIRRIMSVTIPDWLPLWVQFLILGLALVILIAFLLMPFAVYGVKGRLREIELQLADMQASLRVMTMRLSAASSERPPAQKAAQNVSHTPQDEWTPPPTPPKTPEPEFKPRPPKPSSAGMASSPLFRPSMLEPSPSGLAAGEPVSTPAREEKEIREEKQAEAPSPRPFSGLVATRISDAYEPGEAARMPELRITKPAETAPRQDFQRMPWHERPGGEKPSATESPVTESRVPESRVPESPAPARPERTEPVLRWPSRSSE